MSGNNKYFLIIHSSISHGPIDNIIKEITQLTKYLQLQLIILVPVIKFSDIQCTLNVQRSRQNKWKINYILHRPKIRICNIMAIISLLHSLQDLTDNVTNTSNWKLEIVQQIVKVLWNQVLSHFHRLCELAFGVP